MDRLGILPMANKRHPDRLTQWKIIKLFRDGVYRVDLDEGIIFGRNGKPLSANVGNEEGHLFVQLYDMPGCKKIALHRLVWMIGAGHPIPTKWEVHHEDRDVKNCRWPNLFCLHPKDHHKVHNGWNVEEDDDEIPF